MATALVLVGHGRYSDPWHDDAAVGHLVAQEVAAAGLRPVLRSTLPSALDDLAAHDLGLVVLKAGTGRADGDADTDWTGFLDRLASYFDAGVPTLALHQAANTFGNPRWYTGRVGGRWTDGVSWHPPIGDLAVRPVDAEHPVTAGLAPFTVYDEGYLDLGLEPGIRPLAVVEHEGAVHPVVWQGPGPGRVVYDALGHDWRSLESAGHRDLLRRAIAWLTEASAPLTAR